MRERLPRPLRAAWDLVDATIAAGNRHELGLYAPAIAYSLVVSLAPLTIALNLLGPAVIEGIDVLPGSPLAEANLTPEGLYGVVVERSGPLAPIVILALVVIGASNLFRQVVSAISRIWQQGPAPGGLRALLRHRLFSVALLVVAVAALFLSSVLGNALAALGELLVRSAPSVGLELGWVRTALRSRFGVDFVFSTVLFAVASVVVPRVRPHLRDVLPGALLTGLAYAIGQEVLASYLSSASRFDALGSFGALLAFLIWGLYTSTIMLWGAELTHEIALRRACARGGSDAVPYLCATSSEGDS